MSVRAKQLQTAAIWARTGQGQWHRQEFNLSSSHHFSHPTAFFQQGLRSVFVNVHTHWGPPLGAELLTATMASQDRFPLLPLTSNLFPTQLAFWEAIFPLQSSVPYQDSMEGKYCLKIRQGVGLNSSPLHAVPPPGQELSLSELHSSDVALP